MKQNRQVSWRRPPSRTKRWASFLLIILWLSSLSACGQSDTGPAVQAQALTPTLTASATPPSSLIGTWSPTDIAAATAKAQEFINFDLTATALAALPTMRPDATREPYTPEPTASILVGLLPFDECGGINETQDKQFWITSCWNRLENNLVTTLVAGGLDMEPAPGQWRSGAVQVISDTLGIARYEESPYYWTPMHIGWLKIITVQGSVATLQSENGTTLYFDMDARQWLDNPNSTPIPATPTPTPAAFPSTSILDDFNRADGPVGSNWLGGTQTYSIAGNALHNVGGDAQPLLWNASFGANQEVFTTISNLDADASEVDLLLKAQDTTPCNLLEVWYQPAQGTAQVWTCHNWGTWTQHGADIPLSLVAGDQFGARAQADGTVTVYKNGTAVGSVTVDSSWPYIANGGRVGVWLIDAPGTVLDDVGGGTLP